MPIQDREDAAEVQAHIDRILGPVPDGRAAEIRRLFVEALDFNADQGQVPLADPRGGAELPENAERIAELEGVRVLYVALNAPENGRVRTRDVNEAARLLDKQLGDDLLLVFTNADASQLHLVRPELGESRPTLRRMVVDRDLPQRTAVQQISNIYWEHQETGSIRSALDNAFDVEPVTKQFFAAYRRVFEQAKQSVTGFAASEGDDRQLFVQTLFNRLMFVYFLQRKGWLEFQGDKDYLNALWRDYQATPEQANFHDVRLRSLFFFGLNNGQSRDFTRADRFPDSYMGSLIGSPPFLNGGLFEPGDLDRRKGVIVPDAAIEAVLTELFDRFNFTVMESTPFDIEVAVDPEMLGKVFEELVTGRHESGSYYTPRPVVSFMCREALKGYLEARETGLMSETIAEFVDEHRTEAVDIAAARRVAEALSEVTVVDPACGSGAYLLGMMQELVELQRVLYNAGVDAKTLYDLKLEIIERNLYGVDIDEFAVNIAMLRMWLSLAIDYEGDRPEPLPNLDFKVVCGDSLLGPDPSQLNLDRSLIEQSDLGRLKGSYLRESDGSKKDAIWDQIVAAEEHVRTALGGATVPDAVVDWRVEFAEVFAEGGGFDIAIANPPYVRMEQIKSFKRELAALYPAVYAGRADYFVYFFSRAVQSLRESGVLAFITSNAYLRAGYGKKLRAYLVGNLALSTIVDFADLPVFAATVDTTVLVGRKQSVGEKHFLRITDLGPPVLQAVAAEGLAVTPQAVNRTMERLPVLLDDHSISDFPQRMLRDDGWILEDPALIRLFDRLMNLGTPLGEFVGGRIYMGIKTGRNEAFVIDQTQRDALVEADDRSAEIIKPWLRGRDIGQWKANWAGLYIIFANRGVDIDQYPAIREHLASFRTALERRATAGLHPWYELQQPQEGIYEAFDSPKIVWPDIARGMRFAQVAGGSYLANKAYFTPSAETWLLAPLNSSLMEFLVRQLTNSLRGGAIQGHTQYMARLPVVTPDTGLRRRFGAIAEAGIVGAAVDSEALNDLVYDLYGLSSADVTLVRDWFERRSPGS